MTNDPALQVLYSREKHPVVMSLHSDLPEYAPTEKTVEWQQSHRDKHAFREIMLVLSGSTVQYLNGKYYLVTAGDMVLFNRKEVHMYGFSPETGGSTCWLGLFKEHIYMTLVDTAGKSFKYRIKTFIPRTAAVDMLEKAWDKASSTSAGTDEKTILIAEISACANLIFTGVWRHIREIPDFAERPTYAADAVRRVQQYLQNHCGATIQEMTHVAGYSASHLARIFKQHTRLGIKEYIDVIRKEKYNKYKNIIPPKQLAGMLGFGSSAAYFHWVANKNKLFVKQLEGRSENT